MKRFTRDDGFVCRREIELPAEVWRIIREAHATCLYGETYDDVIVALMRPGMHEAVRIGMVSKPEQRN